MDYSKYYNLEWYLFNEVHNKFLINKSLDAFDFFCIIIWKANRSKTKQADRIQRISHKDDMDEICKEITSGIYNKITPSEKLEYLLIKWKFRLPTASAILTVLYPDIFTVYDVRICEHLTQYSNLANKRISEILIGYESFVESIKKTEMQFSSLRDKDKYLWGKSFHDDLVKDVSRGFKNDFNGE